MAITALEIHPAIGIARVGNSPDYFIGPERPFERPNPSGGFKDDNCRVKRQAARFRVWSTLGFVLEEDGEYVEVDRCVRAAPPRITEVAIDPLALLLSPSVYVRLTLPDPPPDENWRHQVADVVSAMTPRQRKATLSQVEALTQRLDVLKKALLQS
ncbi:MAG TPA: LodA/GoxA family CTQ-dependent oxidase [Polyangiales bacterium]|nr:LodA/GoxA family CTQ-dependent oxidase [Polyangiales bacterium]